MTATIIGGIVLVVLFLLSIIGNVMQFKTTTNVKKDKETTEDVNRKLVEQNQVLSDRNRKSTLDSLSDGSF